jgi:hypothetical protein
MIKNFFYGSLFLFITVAASACKSESEDWVKSPGIEISVYKEYENGKPYLTVFYENFGQDTVEKIKYQLISIKDKHADTTVREIIPPKLLRPKDRHTVPRHIGEDTVAAEEVHVGQVWVVKNK